MAAGRQAGSMVAGGRSVPAAVPCPPGSTHLVHCSSAGGEKDMCWWGSSVKKVPSVHSMAAGGKYKACQAYNVPATHMFWQSLKAQGHAGEATKRVQGFRNGQCMSTQCSFEGWEGRWGESEEKEGKSLQAVAVSAGKDHRRQWWNHGKQLGQ